MKTLRVYGDSFVAATPGFKCWPEILSDRLSIPLVNRGVSGSSTEYSIKCFVEDVQHKNISDDDIVIFVTSTAGRLHFSFQNNDRPDTGSAYLHRPESRTRDWWYFQNKDFIEWTIVNQDVQLLDINHEAYIHLIEGVARSKPNATFILLGNSDHRTKVGRGDFPKNFLQSETFLNTISQNEYIEPVSYPEWTKHTRWDLRVNHMSIPNLHIMAEQINQSINSGVLSNLTYDKFKTKIMSPISSKSQYLDYIKNNYIYDMYSLDWFTKTAPILR